MIPILTLTIAYEQDVVSARQRARQIASALGLDGQDQTRIATAVSELARNAFNYAKGGRVEFTIDAERLPQRLAVTVSDRGPGIPNLDEIMSGRYQSRTGMGLGLIGARRLVDGFDIRTAPGEGTIVRLDKHLPATRAATAATASRIGELLARETPMSAVDEVQRQNRELLAAMEELARRQEEIARVNRELEDTNRGVVALYAELDERADHLRRADELKSRFLSNMSHEFRTPLNSIIALSQLLIDRLDGDLTPEQDKQVRYVQKAARELSDVVNDLLDIAKVEAGKLEVRPAEFTVSALFGALRGMLRPLLANESVALVFDDPADLPPLYTDEAKVSQILRNFISNALKFTERGEVRVSATLVDGDAAVRFAVADTGIGIAAGDQERIFEEFSQVEHPIQTRVRGTGLGLPLTRRLAELLGGAVGIESAVGLGSTFTAVVPVRYGALRDTPSPSPERAPRRAPGRAPVLLVTDAVEVAERYAGLLRGSGWEIVTAVPLARAPAAAVAAAPRAIVVDARRDIGAAWSMVATLAGDPGTRDVPVLAVSAVDDGGRALGRGAQAWTPTPLTREWLTRALAAAAGAGAAPIALVVDDDPVARYVARQRLEELGCAVTEAGDGDEGIERAALERPDVILLDLVMPRRSGFAVLDALEENPATRDIPVVILTSKRLDEQERRRLAPRVVTVFAKDTVGYALPAALERAWSVVAERSAV
ncbi:MAG TPA: ATP-binding protein [Terriglobales bacterium]|nr:ATP-binding protein [Terriglobales bacterium]